MKSLLYQKKVIIDIFSGLDSLHASTLQHLEKSKNDDSAPAGCVKERIGKFAPRTCLEHVELAESLKADGEGGHIPHQLYRLLNQMKNEYLSFIKVMQEPSFRERIEAEIETEKKKKVELEKREKQLRGQIDNLISESLRFLNGRLGELGITAKNSPEFIEKAKGIVCNHHDLQRKKVSLEAEIQQLEIEAERLARAKEAELVDKLVKTERYNGTSPAQIREYVKREIDGAVNGHLTLTPADVKVAPLLNKLSDVTFTKCPSDSSAGVELMVRKRPRESGHKQRDWPEKKTKYGKGVEESPEALAKRIMEEGRNLERKTSAATLIISPTKSSTQQHHGQVEVRKIEALTPPPPRVTPPKASSVPSVAAAVAAINARSSGTVDLPKIDLAASMQASSGQEQLPPLVLPQHPESRSRSSEHTTDEISFAKSKVSATPRAEQFEDRLKTIIHSVLSSDAESKHSTSLSMSASSQPMFSPVKRELPSQLPPPPNTHPHPRAYPAAPPHSSHSVGPPPPSSHSHAMYGHGAVHHPGYNKLKSYPPTSASSRTMNDLISSEIERSMADRPSSSGRRPSYGDYPPRSLPSSGASNMGRMSQVIEDSIRGAHGLPPPPPPHSSYNAPPLPRGGPPRPRSPPVSYQRARSPLNLNSRPTTSTAPPTPRSEYPAMEGLAARFGPYMDRANREQPSFRSTPSSSSPPILPPKKQQQQHGEGQDYRMPKGMSK